MEDLITETLKDIKASKTYPNRAATKTTKSVLDIQMEVADKESKGKKGISLYCGIRHEFIFIENSRGQSNHIHKLIPGGLGQRLKQEIAPNTRTKQWQD